MLEFFTAGEPAPQGSKNPWGGEANKRTKPWREAIAADAQAALAGEPAFPGLVKAELRFTFARPQAHFGTGRNAARLKDSAPLYKGSKPDLDKLVRAVGDALTQAGVIRDDSKIASIATAKTYGDTPGVRVILHDL